MKNKQTDSTQKMTMRSLMTIDLYVDKKTSAITIMHDKPLVDELLKLRYYKQTKELYFVFSKGAIPFGSRLSDEIEDYLEKNEKAVVLRINKNTMKPISGVEPPLEIISE